jgi:hypothetical protein
MKKMNLIFNSLVAVSFSVIFFACNKTETNKNNTLTKEEKEQGWELLFDGKTFAGWRGLGRDTVETNHWKF